MSNIVMVAMASLNEKAFAEPEATAREATALLPAPGTRPQAAQDEDSIARGIVDAVLSGAADTPPVRSRPDW